MKAALSLDSIVRHNKRHPMRWTCLFFGHVDVTDMFARVADANGTQLCTTRICDRCGRIKIDAIVKKNLNRRERRR